MGSGFHPEPITAQTDLEQETMALGTTALAIKMYTVVMSAHCHFLIFFQ